MKKTNTKIIGICLNIIFHFLRCHKEELTSFRAWLVARQLIDEHGEGRVSIKKLAKCTGLKKDYLIRICKNSSVFRGSSKDYAYYCSLIELLKKHRLTKKLIIRLERVNAKFKRNFKKKSRFIAYIIKCYVERDINKKFKIITHGRISYQTIADYFFISRRTAIYAIKKSDCRKFHNRYIYKHIQFADLKEFGNWLLRNMDTKIGGVVVGDNPFSFGIVRDNNSYVLRQDRPNVYKFTGFSLVGRKRGKSKKKSSIVKHKPFRPP